ncbi:DUF3369 domain-containing protein [Psychrosphaera aestuarii]|uniref:DUF3369 domain-containing protein n=1 Tax=Psychrosphaera aestuarii TaxID=1266052 RepID=UPI001B33287E|nr:HD domain-containing phosphohydrolase [Psychrosphaera aestuarii]
MTSNDDAPLFTMEELQEEFVETQIDLNGWKVLIVDDEPSIHTVTKLALQSFSFADKPLNFYNAYSASEARSILEIETNIAVILLDVVMETDNAGLELVDYIRNDLDNHDVRIILRTGQPGQAPEYEVIKKYDINDYKEKTELTNQKLNTVIYAALRSYRDITAINRTRIGLERIIKSTSSLLQENSLKDFAEGALQQLAAMMHIDADVVLAESTSAFASKTKEQIKLLACIDHGRASINDRFITHKISNILNTSQIPRDKMVNQEAEFFYISTVGKNELILYLEGANDVLRYDTEILEIFCKNISIAIENIRLNDELKRTQEEIVYSICEVAETRSKETGNHVRRVALYSKLIGEKYGLDKEQVEQLFLAAPLHDVGKIGIPDSVLNRPGKLEGENWEVMKTHAQIGESVLLSSNLPIMEAASIVAAQHHENFDGSGYPRGLKGNDIHIYGRIVALADVFDALMNARCYKPAWDLQQVDALLNEERGNKFDPHLVDIYFNHKEEFLKIHQQYSD